MSATGSHSFIVVTTLVLTLMAAIPSPADEIVSRWVGGASGRWAVPSNWNPVGMPNNGANTYHVVIDGDPGQGVEVILDLAPINIQTLTIDAGDTLTMNAPASLFIRGGLIDLDGLLRINPLDTGLARLFIATQNAQVIGDGEIHMLGQPGRCLIQVSSNLTLTLGDSAPGPGNDTVLRGSGVIQGGNNSTLEVLERVVSNIDGDDLIFFGWTIDVDDVIEGAEGLLSIVDSNVSGSGSIETTGPNIVGVRDSTFDGTDGLTLRGSIEMFANTNFEDALLEAGSLNINDASNATFNNVTTNQFDIEGNSTGTITIEGDNTITNSAISDVTINSDNSPASITLDNSAIADATINGNNTLAIDSAPGTSNEIRNTVGFNVFAGLSDAVFMALNDVEFHQLIIESSGAQATVLQLNNATVIAGEVNGNLQQMSIILDPNAPVSFSGTTLREAVMNIPADAQLDLMDVQFFLSTVVADGNGEALVRTQGNIVFVTTQIEGNNGLTIESQPNSSIELDATDVDGTELKGDPDTGIEEIIVRNDSGMSNATLSDVDVTFEDLSTLTVTNLNAENVSLAGDPNSDNDLIDFKGINFFNVSTATDVRIEISPDSSNDFVEFDVIRVDMVVSPNSNVTITDSTVADTNIDVQANALLTLDSSAVVDTNVMLLDTAATAAIANAELERVLLEAIESGNGVDLSGNSTLDDVTFSNVDVTLENDATVTITNSTVSDTNIDVRANALLTLDSSAVVDTNVMLSDTAAAAAIANAALERLLLEAIEGANGVDLSGNSTLDDVTFSNVDVTVADQSMTTATNLTVDTTTFTGTGSALFRMQAQANIADGTFDDIDIIFGGQPFTLSAKDVVYMSDLTLTIDGQTNVQTDNAATIQYENVDILGTNQDALFTGIPNVNVEFVGGTNSYEVPIDLEGDICIYAEVVGYGIESMPGLTNVVDLRLEDAADYLAFGLQLIIEDRIVIEGALTIEETTARIREYQAAQQASMTVDPAPGPVSPSLVEIESGLTFAITDETSWSWGPESVLAMTGGIGSQLGQWEDWGRLEVGGTDLATAPAANATNLLSAPVGFENNFDLSVLRIGQGAHVYLEDLIDNGNRNGPFGAREALYVDTVEFADADAQLNLNGIHIYYRSLIGNPSQIIDVPIE